MTRYTRISAFLGRLASRARAVHARLTGVSIAAPCHLGPRVALALGPDPARRGTIMVGPRAHLETGVILHPWGGAITLGENVFLGPGVVIYGHGGVTIGDDTLISMHCRILSSNHTVPPPGTLIRSQPDLPLSTVIGPDVWLGAGVTILGGVTLGAGCIVGAGAVVTRDLPAGSVAVGVPARVVGKRGIPPA